MCDFSCYAGVSDEWLAIEANLPPPPVTELDLSEMKKIGNKEREALSARGMHQFTRRITMKDYVLPTRDGETIEARVYRPTELAAEAKLPVYIHLHGGGFVFGTLDTENATCCRIACAAGVVVLNLNYRHVPKYTYPTQWHDAEDAIDWVHENMAELGGDPSRVILGGVSAGAWVTASVVLDLHLRRESLTHPPLAGQVLMIPCVAHVDCYEPQLKKMKHHSVSSYKENEKAPLLSMVEMRYFVDMLEMKNPHVDDLMINPGNASPSQVEGMPPTVFGIMGLDPLRDEGLLYAKMLTEAG